METTVGETLFLKPDAKSRAIVFWHNTAGPRPIWPVVSAKAWAGKCGFGGIDVHYGSGAGMRRKGSGLRL